MATAIPLEMLSERVAFCDPSGGKSEVKKVQARSAIVVLTQDWLERVFVLFAWAKRTSTDSLIDKLFWVNDTFRPTRFGIEANAMQSLFADCVRREARSKFERMPIEPVHQPTQVQKPFRNRAALQPCINQGRLFIPEKFVELRHELGTHPMNSICDLVDATASAMTLLRRRPALEVAENDEMAFARYLRRQGLSPSKIEQKLAERRARRGLNPNGTNAGFRARPTIRSGTYRAYE